MLYFIHFCELGINQHLDAAALPLPLSYVTFPRVPNCIQPSSGVNAGTLYVAYAHLTQMQYIILPFPKLTHKERCTPHSHQVWRKKTCTKWVIVADGGEGVCTVVEIHTDNHKYSRVMRAPHTAELYIILQLIIHLISNKAKKKNKQTKTAQSPGYNVISSANHWYVQAC